MASTIHVEAARIPDRDRLLRELSEGGLNARPVDEVGIEVPCDGDEAALTLLSEVLERDAYAVETALSVEEAIGKLQHGGPFDAVLTDLRMPVASGLDLVSYVREHDPDAVAIFLTPSRKLALEVQGAVEKILEEVFAGETDVPAKALSGHGAVVVTKNLDEAIEWAAKCPGARVGSIEVRPIMEFG